MGASAISCTVSLLLKTQQIIAVAYDALNRARTSVDFLKLLDVVVNVECEVSALRGEQCDHSGQLQCGESQPQPTSKGEKGTTPPQLKTYAPGYHEIAYTNGFKDYSDMSIDLLLYLELSNNVVTFTPCPIQ